MRLKNLRLKLKINRLKRFLIKNVKRKSRKLENGTRLSWMNQVSHGYHVVELGQTWTTTPNNRRKFDPVVVQREESEDCELWYFGVFDDDGVAEEITKYMQSNFFNRLPKEQSKKVIVQSNMGKKSKECMKRAHLKARSNIVDRDEGDAAARKSGSASAMVINGERLVMANTGGYKAVVCRDGEAYEICRKRQHPTSVKWPLRFFAGGLRVPKVHKIESWERSEVIVGSERVDSETEFVILASSGVWEVMRQQEAVNLIRHIEDAQAAAECLANEALIRMSKSIVSCLIIRFH